MHYGKLELITWSVGEMGWGNTIADESGELKDKFDKEFGGDEEKLHDYWPRAFRWTCCGTRDEQQFGCDHHGRGPKPCTCDFCQAGKPIPDKFHAERLNSPEGHGLDLPRGPDTRSYNSAAAGIAVVARSLLGMDRSD